MDSRPLLPALSDADLPGWHPDSWSPYLDDLCAGTAHPELVAALTEAELLVPTFRGPWAPLPLLLDRLPLTHRLSAAELAGGYLELDPDLSLLFEPVNDAVPFARGGLRATRLLAAVIPLLRPWTLTDAE